MKKGTTTSNFTTDHKLLVNWYKANKRDLPWRQNKDAYRIWLSEVMLQQTTVVAVIPYYNNFLEKFPNLKALAQAPQEQVVEAWAGLGYYSRARNLHKAAQLLNEKGFPKTAAELIEFPGFGPYTSRAVSSIAFDEPVGVLDGNVIRVLSRRYGIISKWWEPKHRQQLQDLSDSLAREGEPSQVNQALMELGATVCTPQKVMCILCPWNQSCEARKTNQVEKIPLKKPRRQIEVWVWEVDLIEDKTHKIALIQNDYLPFLKGQWIFPGKISKQDKKPDHFDVQHSITHHSIFVKIKKRKSSATKAYNWTSKTTLKKVNPSSLLQKILKSADKT